MADAEQWEPIFPDELRACRWDEIYANFILQRFEGHVVNTAMGLLMYDEWGGYWREDPSDHMVIVQAKSLDIFIELPGTKNKSFGQLFKAAYKIVIKKAPVAFCLAWEKSRGYLLFKNGVLDMINNVMLPNDPKYCFMRCIQRDYDPDGPHEDLKIEVSFRFASIFFTRLTP